jgi:hypothetical protein
MNEFNDSLAASCTGCGRSLSVIERRGRCPGCDDVRQTYQISGSCTGHSSVSGTLEASNGTLPSASDPFLALLPPPILGSFDSPLAELVPAHTAPTAHEAELRRLLTAATIIEEDLIASVIERDHELVILSLAQVKRMEQNARRNRRELEGGSP